MSMGRVLMYGLGAVLVVESVRFDAGALAAIIGTLLAMAIGLRSCWAEPRHSGGRCRSKRCLRKTVR